MEKSRSANPSSNEAFINQVATDAARKQITWISVVIGMVVAVAVFFGYQKLASDVEKKARAEVDARVQQRIDQILNQFPEATVRDRIMANTIASLTPLVRAKVDAVIDAQCSNVARLNTNYDIQATNSQWFLADDMLPPAAPRAPVYSVLSNNGSHWKLVGAK